MSDVSFTKKIIHILLLFFPLLLIIGNNDFVCTSLLKDFYVLEVNLSAGIIFFGPP